MSKPDDNLDFSHKDERSHTIKKPHSAPIPVSLQDWLVSILRRLSNKTPPGSDENGDEDKKEE